MKTFIFLLLSILYLPCLGQNSNEDSTHRILIITATTDITTASTDIITASTDLTTTPIDITTRPTGVAKKRINFFVANQTQKPDLTELSTLLRAKIHARFSKGRFFLIRGRSDSMVICRITGILEAENGLIGSLWLDSHGLYGKGYSLVLVGKTEFNYRNVHDSGYNKHLRALGTYCDEHTIVAIGSCYGGATFDFPAVESFPSRPMRGDSLIIYLSRIFNGATVYGSESWVMVKPGMWKRTYAIGGYPLGRRFYDSMYLPVWQRLGQWNRFSPSKGEIERVNTITLDRKGNIGVQKNEYLIIKRHSVQQNAKMKKLKRGCLNLAALYR